MATITYALSIDQHIDYVNGIGNCSSEPARALRVIDHGGIVDSVLPFQTNSFFGLLISISNHLVRFAINRDYTIV